MLDANREVDLNVFEAAWRYRHGGLVGGIKEGRFSPADLMAGVAKGWLAQYAEGMDRLDPLRHQQKFLISGGLSRRASFIVPTVSALSGRNARLAEVVTGEETLDGLLAMSRACTPAL